MNEHDRSNLEFLLNSSPETLKHWIDTMIDTGQEDDIAYAFELLEQARILVRLELLDVLAEEDLGQAQQYLQRFQLQ